MPEALLCFLDDVEPIDWNDFERASSLSQELTQKLVADRDLLRSLVFRTETDEGLLSLCGHRDLLHKIVIYEALDRGFRVQVNIATDMHLDRIHNHRFSFTSCILNGSYRHTWYQPEEPVRGGMDIRAFRRLLVKTEGVGSCYSLHHEAIHTTFTTPGLVSLCFRGTAAKDRSVVVDTKTGKSWWRYGHDEGAEQREGMRMTLPAYTQLRRHLIAVGVI